MLFAALLASFGAASAPLTFSADLNGALRAATVETSDAQGVVYISLSQLAAQLGGAHRVSGARVVIAFGDATATGGLNDTRVETGNAPVALRYPLLLAQGGDALIAAADVQVFFSGAFGYTVRPLDESVLGQPAAQPAPEGQLGVRELADAELAAPPISAPPAEAVAPAMAPPVESAPAATPIESTPSAPPLEPLGTPLTQAAAPQVALKMPSKQLTTVVIDPGHGGNDAGCTGQGGVLEKDVTMRVAQALARVLKETTSLRIFVTRKEDRDMTAVERASEANQQQGDLLISIHTGASYTPQAHGIELFYLGPEGSESAITPVAVRAAVSAASQQAAETAAQGVTAACEAELRGIHEARIRVLENAAMPGFLIEVGCLTNPSEEALLQADAYCEKVARGIAAGLARYMGAPSGETQ